MILINLTPQQFQKKRHGLGRLMKGLVVPRDVVFGVLGGVAVLLVFFHIMLQLLIFIRLAEHQIYKAQWEAALPNKKNVTRIEQEIKKRAARISSIQKILGKQHICWSRAMNDVSGALTRGVWLRKIVFKEGVLLVEGSGVSQQKIEKINITQFLSGLKETPSFAESFNTIEVTSIRSRDLSGTMVADFVIKASQPAPVVEKPKNVKIKK